VLLAESLQLRDRLASFLFMFAQLLDLIHSLVEISNHSTGLLDLVRQASNVVVTFHGHHHSISTFSGSTQDVAILGVLHLTVLIMM
jgi:hypothetical protein